jgi:hypothetical protein
MADYWIIIIAAVVVAVQIAAAIGGWFRRVLRIKSPSTELLPAWHYGMDGYVAGEDIRVDTILYIGPDGKLYTKPKQGEP